MGARAGPELCAALLLGWLCCWPEPSRDETSSSRKHSRKPVVVDSNSSRRSGEAFGRRIGSSAISLHLPSTSGSSKKPLSAHRSHEEIRSRRKSHLEANEETRYHSAPSVIDEVIHRRDWERSTKDIYIPLNPQNECHRSVQSDDSSSPEAPCAEPESSSVECLKEPKREPRKCKKHHTNIKSSNNRCKESNKDDIKDTDATETAPNFYIGDKEESLTSNGAEALDLLEYERLCEERSKWIYKGKSDKQSLNETIKLMDRSPSGAGAGGTCRPEDRSGAVHHTIESRISFSRPYPLPSVETVGYEGGACYLAETGRVSGLRERAGLAPSGPRAGLAAAGLVAGADLAAAGGGRPRHASDGDILAPPHRPESGAFSESDLDFDLEACEERPPAYHEVQLYASPDKKETAI